MPQTYTKLGQSLGDMLGGFASGNGDAYKKGENEGASIAYRREAARKMAAEADQLQQFQDPAKRSELVTGLLGLGKSEAEQLNAFGRDGNWGSGVFQRAQPDLEMARGGLDYALNQPATMSAPDTLLAQPQPDSALTEVLRKFNTPKDVVLPNSAPGWGDNAIRLNALVRGAGDKAMTPQTLPALLAQAAAAKAIESGDMTALNAYNTLAKEGATYTPYKTDTHGRTANEGSGAVNITDAPLHDANIGKLVADAIQRRAAAAASAAQADKHRFDMAKPKNQQEDKPMPVQAMKLQEENIDAISTAQGIKTDLSAFVNQLDSGALNLGVISNTWSGAKNFTGNSDEQSRNYQSFNATLEKLRNDSLRLNKGVQTDGDAQRAWNELLTNINDPKVVRQRLSEIQAINDRAVKIRMARNNNLRRNYDAPEMDYTPYLNQEPVINGGAQQTQSVQVVRTGTLNGRKVMQFSDGSIQYAE